MMQNFNQISIDNFTESVDISLPISIHLFNLDLDAHRHRWPKSTTEQVIKKMLQMYREKDAKRSIKEILNNL